MKHNCIKMVSLQNPFPTVVQSPSLFSSSSSIFLWPFPTFLLSPPLHFIPPLFHCCFPLLYLTLPPSLAPEGMSKFMVEWRREVGLALPNSISEKPEFREACCPHRANVVLLLQFCKWHWSIQLTEINVNTNTN